MTTISTPLQGTTTMLAEGCTGVPRVSGNGKVVVWSQEKQDGHAAVMRYEDGQVTQVSEDGYDCGNPCVSDDGSVIAYSRYSPANSGAMGNFDIYQFRASGKDAEGKVTGTNSPVAAGVGNELSVAVSGDGKTIAFDDDINGSFATWRIGKWHDGTVTFLTNGKPDAEFPFIADATGQVFFREFKGGHCRTSGEAPDGSIKVAIQGPGDTIRPDVSGDGQVFAWTDNSRASEQVMTLRDGQKAPLLSDDQVDYAWPRLNADGSQLVCVAMDRRVPDPSKPAVSLLHKQGDQVSPIAVGDASGMPIMPDISNDGRTVVWEWVDNADSGHTRIMMFRAADAPTA